MDKVFLTLKVFVTFLFLLFISNQANANNKLTNQATLQISRVSGLSPMTCHNSIAACHIILNTFLENSGFVEIINLSRITALNVRAVFPPSIDIINESVCPAVAPRETCRLEFGPAFAAHPTTLIPVVGDNTNTVYFELEVIAVPPSIRRN
ncbi:transmembrane protein [Legionella busanensis]|uniref:Transmembrane protein n=2 Tax=Legionella busanensis TaxID=190655 RepID=A0A378JMH9_9GAMM|nr:hypothetical protein [Legionella busanensis]STX52434.1 transmembrane protein [Legionella busanensis]